MSQPVTDDERQRLNVRAIRVTLDSALRFADPARAELCRARARQLLDMASARGTSRELRAEIDALRGHIDAERGAAEHTGH